MTSDAAAAWATRSRTADGPAPDTDPRVRHQARDALTLMSFSLAVSVSTALGLLVLTHLGL